MLKLYTRALIEHSGQRRLLKVCTLPDLAKQFTEPCRVALLIDDPSTRDRLGTLLAAPWGACISTGNSSRPEGWTGSWISALADPKVVASGDVIAIDPGSQRLSVLFRRGSNGNVLFLTEQCNSRCLMCSQPPREVDDSWRTDETLELIDLIDSDEPSLAITGGEPTLLGDQLVRLVDACRRRLPSTALHILSNGRALKDFDLVRHLASVGHPNLVWAIPLYADTPARHDYVVQAAGAFEETIRGLSNLARFGQQVEIRVVLQQQTVPRLQQLAYFIFRNLSFVAHVAFMGLEPMGFARSNRDLLWIDPVDYSQVLESAVYHLHCRGLAVSVYNLPLCVLPRSLWPFARRSISDWKQTYVEACTACAAQPWCGGFFVSAGSSWRGRDIRPIAALDVDAARSVLEA